jgi:hypothetical protein
VVKFKKPSQSTIDRASCYQWVIKGKPYSLDEMSRGQLMEALMDTVDAVEGLEDKMADVNAIFEKWREGGDWDT